MPLSLVSSSESPAGVLEVWRRVLEIATEALDREEGASDLFLFVASGIQTVCLDEAPGLPLRDAGLASALSHCLRRGAADHTVHWETVDRGVPRERRVFIGCGVEGSFRRRGTADQTVPREEVLPLRMLLVPAPRARKAKRTKRCPLTNSPHRLHVNSLLPGSPQRVTQHLVSRTKLGSQRLTTLWIVSDG